MEPLRIFLAQPVDFVNTEIVDANFQKVCNLLQGLPIEILAPYLDDASKTHDFYHDLLDRRRAKKIVEEDYAAIDRCDLFLADLSREDRQAVGMIFEMAYAAANGKPIIVYVNGSSLAHRVWMIAVSDAVCHTWLEVKDAIEAAVSRKI